MRGKPNIWTLAVRQQQYQIDVRSVEELFGHQEETATSARGTASHAGTSNHVSRSRSFKESAKEEVNIIHTTRCPRGFFYIYKDVQSLYIIALYIHLVVYVTNQDLFADIKVLLMTLMQRKHVCSSPTVSKPSCTAVWLQISLSKKVCLCQYGQ